MFLWTKWQVMCCMLFVLYVILLSKYLGLITMVWFWMKTWHFVHGRFHKTGPHKEFAMYSDISLPKVVKSMFCKHYVCIFGKFHCFPLHKLAFGYFAKGILQNFAYFPTKFIYFMSNVLLFCIMFVFYQNIT